MRPKITVEIDGPPLAGLPPWDAAASRAVGETIVAMIVARTSRGQGLDGPFEPYPDAPTDRVDLKRSGQMLASIQVVAATDGHAAVELTGRAAGYGPYVDARRPFMGVTADEIDELMVDVARMAGRLLVAGAP